MYALNCSLASLRSINNEYNAIVRIVSQLNDAMESSYVEIIKQKAFKYNKLDGMTAPDLMVKKMLRQLCHDLDKDLVVFLTRRTCLLDRLF
jgi:hypothetical protein